jgi:hypothetical protein
MRQVFPRKTEFTQVAKEGGKRIRPFRSLQSQQRQIRTAQNDLLSNPLIRS